MEPKLFVFYFVDSSANTKYSDYMELIKPHNTTLSPRSKGEVAKNVIQLIICQGPNLCVNFIFQLQTVVSHSNLGSTVSIRVLATLMASYFNGNQKDVFDIGKGVELWWGIFLYDFHLPQSWCCLMQSKVCLSSPKQAYFNCQHLRDSSVSCLFLSMP